jgi:hypothetical protein
VGRVDQVSACEMNRLSGIPPLLSDVSIIRRRTRVGDDRCVIGSGATPASPGVAAADGCPGDRQWGFSSLVWDSPRIPPFRRTRQASASAPHQRWRAHHRSATPSGALMTPDGVRQSRGLVRGTGESWRVVDVELGMGEPRTQPHKDHPAQAAMSHRTPKNRPTI